MFRSLLRAGSEDRSPWGDFWFKAIGGLARSVTGRRVNADTAMQQATVFTCVRVLAESFAILPLRMYRPKVGGRGRTEVKDHWMVRLLTRQPNRFQNPFEWAEMLQGHVALRGNAYCEILEDGQGGIAELLPLHPDRVRVEQLVSGDYRYAYTDPNGELRHLRRDQVWHLRGLSSDGITGLNPIELHRETIGGALASQDYANRFFENDAKPTGGWIEYPGNIQDKATREKLKEKVKEATSGANRHKTMVLDQGMKYHEVGLTNKDSQFLESRGMSRTEICGLFRVAPHMAGDLTHATFSNIEQQSIDHWVVTMLPWVRRWQAALEQLLGPDSDLQVEYDFRQLLRGDSAARAQYLHNLVLDGIITRNEARAIEGYDPLEGLDEPLVPINEREASEPANGGVQTPARRQRAPAKQKEDDEEADARLVALARAAADRVARKEAAEVFAVAGEGWEARVAPLYAKHAQFVAAALSVSLEAATAYCDAQVGWLATNKPTMTELEALAAVRLMRVAMKGTL
jgi:HK97 family phage portal protein